jgi:hypothetical protein
MKRKLQVFVSSTYSDLIEERQAAVAAILKAGHIPAGMELFTAGDISQMETIKRWIDESDLYMLILAGRYGSIEPTTNLSYTELEYDYAREQGKPVFAVVIEEAALAAKIKAGGSKFIEKENPKALAEFRKKVLQNISSFFSDGKDIKLCVHESVADLSAKSELKGWVSAAEVPDLKSLNAELDSLRRENAALNAEMKRLIAENATKKTSAIVSDEELIAVLKAIEIKVPENVSGDSRETITNLFAVSLANLDALTVGANNAYGNSDFGKFLYFNIFPKLQAHGLADSEKVAGVIWRRSVLNQKGREFFAAIQRNMLLAKAKTAKKK